MTREEMDFIGSMNMCDEISNEAYQKIMTHCEEQEPCDCISRQALRQKLREHYDFFVNAYGGFNNLSLNDKFRVDEITNCIAMVVNAPPVTPQPKVGKWLEKEINSDKVIEEWQSARCSVCDRYHTTPYMYYFDNYKFCPHCGCRMKGDEET